jgi:hypothetical protein
MHAMHDNVCMKDPYMRTGKFSLTNFIWQKIDNFSLPRSLGQAWQVYKKYLYGLVALTWDTRLKPVSNVLLLMARRHVVLLIGTNALETIDNEAFRLIIYCF